MARYYNQHQYSTTDESVWERGDGQQQRSSYDPISGTTTTTTVIRNQPQTIKPTTDSDIYRVGIYGWRKRCLYVFILLLTIVIVLNLALTAWIITVLDISSSGMGAMKILDDGIRVTGRAEFDRPVHLRNLVTAEGRALTIDSSRGVYINARNLSGQITSSINMNPDGRLEAICDRFEVFNANKQLLFFVDSNEIGLKLDNLRILDEGGSVFEGAIQTAVIRPEPDTPLLIESPTRNLIVDAAQDIELLSRAGDMQLTALLDINIHAKQGEIRLDSANVYMSGLQRSEGVSASATGHYQMCLCENGRLFLARQQADCRADRGICE